MSDSEEPIEEPMGGYAVKKGVIVALITIILSLGVYFSGLTGEQWVSWLIMLIVIALVFIFQKRFRDTVQGGYIRFGKAYGLGVIIFLVVGVLNSIYTYFLFTNDPSITESIMEKTYNDLVDQGLPSHQIDQVMGMTESMMTPAMMTVSSVLMYVVLGLIISLITSAIVKRDHPLDVA